MDSSEVGATAASASAGGTEPLPPTRSQVDAWVTGLPYPIAATLHLYAVRRDPAARVEALLHFYEGAAALWAGILCEPLTRDDTFLSAAAQDIARCIRQLDGPTFGTWVWLGKGIAGVARKRATNPTLHAYRITDPARAANLLRDDVWGWLTDAMELRNRISGHGPVATPRQRADALNRLEQNLPRVTEALIALFDGWTLVRPGLLAARAGRFHQRVELLVGATQPFPEETVTLPEPLEEGALYLVESGSAGVLRLPSTIRLVTDEDRFLHVSYFYSRRDGRRVEWISRQLGGAPSFEDTDEGIARFIEQMRREPARTPPPSTPSATASPDAIGAAQKPEVVPVTPTGPAPEEEPLAVRLYAVLRRLDPNGEGRPVAEIAAAAREAGLPSTTPAGDILNGNQDRFVRRARGRWTWVAIDPSIGSGLAGAGLREVVYDLARQLDPSRHGLSHEVLTAELALRGATIAGPSTTRTMWRALGSPAAATRFRPLGRGRFAWVDDAETGVTSSPPVPTLPTAFASRIEMVDAALRDLEPAIGWTLFGDDCTFFLGDHPIVTLRLDPDEPTATVEIRQIDSPHVRGVFLREGLRPGVPRGDGPVELRLGSARDLAALIRLSAAALSMATGRRAVSQRTLDRSMEGIRPWLQFAGPEFLPGVGWFERPKARPPAGGWHAFWVPAYIELGLGHPVTVRRSRTGNGASIGTSGGDGVYRALVVDRLGISVVLWFSDLRVTNGWLDRLEEDQLEIEERAGAPLCWYRTVRSTCIVIHRVVSGEGPYGENQVTEAARALLRVEAAFEPWIERLPERTSR